MSKANQNSYFIRKWVEESLGKSHRKAIKHIDGCWFRWTFDCKDPAQVSICVQQMARTGTERSSLKEKPYLSSISKWSCTVLTVISCNFLKLFVVKSLLKIALRNFIMQDSPTRRH